MTIKRTEAPSHIEATIGTISRLNTEHEENATWFQRAVDRLTAVLSRPKFVAILTCAVGGWIFLNLATPLLGYRPPDPPPFPWLQGVVSLASLYIVVLLLITQRREDQLAEHREQLTLELAILSEQKTAKVIQLLEEVRRDSPLLRDRVDHEANSMAQPADPQSVLDAIKGTHVEVTHIS